MKNFGKFFPFFLFYNTYEALSHAPGYKNPRPSYEWLFREVFWWVIFPTPRGVVRRFFSRGVLVGNFPTPRGVVRHLLRPPGGSEKLKTSNIRQKRVLFDLFLKKETYGPFVSAVFGCFRYPLF